MDATGAGDALCAGVVHKLLELNVAEDIHKLSRDKLIEVLITGQAVGAVATTAVGCVEGVSKDKVEQLIREQGAKILDATSVSPGPAG